MLDYQTIIEIFQNIARAHKGKPHLSINSFALINAKSDIQDISLGRNHKDASKGYYWSRHGVNANNDKKLYPTLFLLKRGLRKKGKETCIEFTIGVAVPEKCKPCGDNFTRLDAEFHAEQLICDIWDIFCQFEVHNVIILNEDGEEYETQIIVHPSQIGECVEVVRDKGICGYLKDYLDQREINVSVERYGSDLVQLASAAISICTCKDRKIEENFDFCKEDKSNPVAIVKCDSCF